MRVHMRSIVAVAAVVAVGVIGFTGSAGAAPAPQPTTAATTAVAPANSVNSSALIDGQVFQRDIAPSVVKSFNTVWNTSVHFVSLDPSLRARVDAGKVTGVESDGPYPGSTDLSKLGAPGSQGSNSTELVPGDAGAATHTVWVKCADGKVATGGGFTLAADASLAAKKLVQVVASEATGDAITGDPAGSLKPTGWQVEVINNSVDAVTVRPWVVCAKVS